MAAQHHLEPIIPLTLWGIDISISQAVTIMWGTSAVILLFFLIANLFRRFRQMEWYLFDFIDEAFAKSLHTQNRLWFSFLITLFMFILLNNLSGLLPGGESPTSNINVTGAMAIFIFLIAQLSGLRTHGFHH